MGSRWVEKNTNSKDRGVLGKNNSKPLMTYLQLVPAKCTNVIVNQRSPYYKNDRDINAIMATPHVKDALGGQISGDDSSNQQKYYPLLRGMVDVPTSGDQVLVCTIGQINYYLGSINTINSPNSNPDFLYKPFKPNVINNKTRNSNLERSQQHKSFDFVEIPVQRLKKYVNLNLDGNEVDTGNSLSGDIMIEGKHANSIRLGSRQVFPYIFISNGRNPVNPVESWLDGSIFSMTSDGKLTDHLAGTDNFRTYVLSSDRNEKNKRMLGDINSSPIAATTTGLYNYEYNTQQTFLSSDKITFDARGEGIFLSSFNDIIMGSAGSMRFRSNKDYEVDATNIYLGKKDSQQQPLVVGGALDDLLSDIIKILESIKVTGTIGGVSGPPDPYTMKKIIALKTKLRSGLHLSRYHNIETNTRIQ